MFHIPIISCLLLPLGRYSSIIEMCAFQMSLPLQSHFISFFLKLESFQLEGESTLGLYIESVILHMGKMILIGLDCGGVLMNLDRGIPRNVCGLVWTSNKLGSKDLLAVLTHCIIVILVNFVDIVDFFSLVVVVFLLTFWGCCTPHSSYVTIYVYP